MSSSKILSRAFTRSLARTTATNGLLRPTSSKLPATIQLSSYNKPSSLSRKLHTTTTLRFHQTSRSLSEMPDYPTSHAKIANPINTTNFIDNVAVESKATQWIDLHDPATNNLVTRVPQSTPDELKAAVDSAAKAFPAWKATSLLHRQQIMFKLVSLIRQNWDRLAASITLEQGKTLSDAKGDVLRGLQVAEVCLPLFLFFVFFSFEYIGGYGG
jgi:malonate-semialdehyde dehydrogenase (acetylating) / methylmalonate-semialdehyde dehydrogenase